jgi:hypothetical protein
VTHGTARLAGGAASAAVLVSAVGGNGEVVTSSGCRPQATTFR